MVTLERYTSAHITDEHLSWLNDERLMRFSRHRGQRHTRETQLWYLGGFDHLSRFLWAVMVDGRMVGTATAYIDGDSADVGFLIGEPGHGYGNEACQAVVAWLTANSGVKFITGGTDVANFAMRRVFESNGFIAETIYYKRDNSIYYKRDNWGSLGHEYPEFRPPA